MKHPLYALLLLPLAGILVWVLWGGGRNGSGAGFTPAAQGIAFTPQTYDADTVFDYMNGGAELYLKHGFKTLKVWTGKTGDAEVTVELYLLDSVENSRALFEQMKSGAAVVGVGETSAALRNGSGVAQAGKFFLRVFAYPEQDGPPRQVLDSFARWYHAQNG
jgi:hypothetical protein